MCWISSFTYLRADARRVRVHNRRAELSRARAVLLNYMLFAYVTPRSNSS